MSAPTREDATRTTGRPVVEVWPVSETKWMVLPEDFLPWDTDPAAAMRELFG